MGFSVDDRCLCIGRNRIPLGCGIIEGVMTPGRETLIRSILADSLSHGMPAIVLQNGSSSGSGILQSWMTEYTYGGSIPHVFDMIRDRYDEGGIDILRGLDYDMASRYILDIFRELRTDLSSSTLEFCRMYLRVLADLMNKLNDPTLVFSIANLRYFTREWIEKKVEFLCRKSRMSESDSRFYEDFIFNYLPDHRAQEYEFRDLCMTLNQYDLSTHLSQGPSVDDILSRNTMLFVTLDCMHKPEQSAAVMKALIRCIVEKQVKDPTISMAIVCEDIDIGKNEDLRTLMMNCSRYGASNFFFTDNNISAFSRGGNWDPVQQSDSFFVFQQVSPDNTKYWSDLIGTKRTTEVSKQYEFGLPFRPISSTRFPTIVPIIDPREFTRLRDGECFFISRVPRKKSLLSGDSGSNNMFVEKLIFR